MADWQPINTAPKDGTELLISLPIANGKKGMAAVSFNPKSQKYPWITIDGKGFAEGAPTHWMPAPDHPQ